MAANKSIAIDAMGGDGGIDITLPASIQVLNQKPDLSIFLVGDESRMQALVSTAPAGVRDRLKLIHSDAVIGDADRPGNVLRSGKQSSMYLAVDLLKTGTAQAMVSAGNTGALLMIGRHLLKTIEGIQKPAIVTTIPGAPRQSFLLDVGANPDCSARQLFEFAVMGSVLAESLGGEKATVGLLNIGSEQYKGSVEVRAAAELMENSEALNYAGFIEANALFEGAADVVVCDGFVGNVMIKASAGVANMVKSLLTEQLSESWLARLSGSFSASMLTRLREQINPHRFNGASLLGLQGSIIKSHGNATIEGFTYAIAQAEAEIENAVPQLIAKRVAAIMAAH
ncbi:MAG: phosphate acyltransferase PlsX [Proteobacteria bacterium]|nr:phosphate acyltransferase PlsX [Pseudomonadota bacterium]